MAATIGERIKTLREERRLSQGALARASGLRQPFVSKVEKGEKKPSPDSVDRIALALGATGESLTSGTECEGAYFAARLSVEENKARIERQTGERLQEQAMVLNAFAAYYDRARGLFATFYEGPFYRISDPTVEAAYQFLVGELRAIMRRLAEFVPDIEGRVHVPETTDGEVLAAGVDDFSKGVELESMWELIDQPKMAKTALYLRQLRAKNPVCASLPVEPLVAARHEVVRPLVEFDEWFKEYRKGKRVHDRRLMDRMIEQGKRHLGQH